MDSNHTKLESRVCFQFWSPHDLLMMGTENFNINASWAEKVKKSRVSFPRQLYLQLSTQVVADHDDVRVGEGAGRGVRGGEGLHRGHVAAVRRDLVAEELVRQLPEQRPRGPAPRVPGDRRHDVT